MSKRRTKLLPAYCKATRPVPLGLVDTPPGEPTEKQRREERRLKRLMLRDEVKVFLRQIGFTKTKPIVSNLLRTKNHESPIIHAISIMYLDKLGFNADGTPLHMPSGNK